MEKSWNIIKTMMEDILKEYPLLKLEKVDKPNIYHENITTYSLRLPYKTLNRYLANFEEIKMFEKEILLDICNLTVVNESFLLYVKEYHVTYVDDDKFPLLHLKRSQSLDENTYSYAFVFNTIKQFFENTLLEINKIKKEQIKVKIKGIKKK